MRRKNFAVVFFTFFALFTIFVSGGAYCGGSRAASPAAGTLRYTRIISAAPSNTDILTGLGQGDRLIAVDPWSKGIPGVHDSLPEIDFFSPDAEAIIALEPDLILVNEINNQGDQDSPFALLSGMGIQVVEVPTSTSIEGIYGDIRKIAEILGVKERGEEMVSSMKTEIDRISAAGKRAPEKKSVYFEISSLPTVVTFGRGVYLNEMIEIAGGKNVFADVQGWASVSEEQIISRNPDVIFAMEYPGEDPVSDIRRRPGFGNITAVKQNRLYTVEGDPASRPSQNIIIALRQIAVALYPDVHGAN